jgi:hypothetical protein
MLAGGIVSLRPSEPWGCDMSLSACGHQLRAIRFLSFSTLEEVLVPSSSTTVIRTIAMEPFRAKDTLLRSEYHRDSTEYHGGRTPVPENASRPARWNLFRYVPSESPFIPKQRVVIQHGVRITLRVLTLLSSLAIIGVLSHTIQIQQSTKGND